MAKTSRSQKVSEYLTVGEAAEVLGVSPWTLRHWDRTGKMRSYRHPVNRYRLYRREDLVALLARIESPGVILNPEDDHPDPACDGTASPAEGARTR